MALRLSRDAVDAIIDEKRVKIIVDLKPALDEETLLARIDREIAEMSPSGFFSELLRKLVPKQVVVPLAKEADYAPFQFAIVTAGGVACDEVNKYTMQSEKVQGLYFAGEVLDIDANTGGYNMQIAFSTGRLAGQLKK